MIQLCKDIINKYDASLIMVMFCLQISINALLEQPQLISNHTESAVLQSSYTQYRGQARVLKPNALCSFINLTECHDNGQMYKLYYKSCFSAHMCPEEYYYCINGDGNTIHICWEFSDCKKRYRNTVLRNKSDSDYVSIYSVPCPDGYFQFSPGNCFHACMEDESVVITRNSTINSPALGHCNSNRGHCNPERVTDFILGSKNDNCVKYTYVENVIKCKTNEDLMPNCSCVHSCLRGQIRTYDRNFICQWPNSSNIPPSSSPGISVYDSVMMSSSQGTSQKTISNPNDGQSNGTWISVTVVVVVVLLLAVAAVVIVVCKAFRRGGEYRDVPVSDNGNPGDIEEGSGQHANGITPGDIEEGSRQHANGITPVTGPVTNVTRTKTSQIFYAEGDIIIRTSHHAAPTAKIQDLDSELSTGDAKSNESSNDLQMENLKSFNNEEDESGIASLDTTFVKRPL